jgi:hypothetical protein
MDLAVNGTKEQVEGSKTPAKTDLQKGGVQTGVQAAPPNSPPRVNWGGNKKLFFAHCVYQRE